MKPNDLNTALYEKMAAEQDKYRDWLKSQPAAEVLNHAYEYTVREDIVMCMEELELTEAQAKALLDSPTPLADVYREFEKLETGYMDVIRDTIESRADEVCKEPEELNPQSVYLHSAAYASEHGETDAYWMSDQANFSCKTAIEQAISRHLFIKGCIQIVGFHIIAPPVRAVWVSFQICGAALGVSSCPVPKDAHAWPSRSPGLYALCPRCSAACPVPLIEPF